MSEDKKLTDDTLAVFKEHGYQKALDTLDKKVHNKIQESLINNIPFDVGAFILASIKLRQEKYKQDNSIGER